MLPLESLSQLIYILLALLLSLLQLPTKLEQLLVSPLELGLV